MRVCGPLSTVDTSVEVAPSKGEQYQSLCMLYTVYCLVVSAAWRRLLQADRAPHP